MTTPWPLGHRARRIPCHTGSWPQSGGEGCESLIRGAIASPVTGAGWGVTARVSTVGSMLQAHVCEPAGRIVGRGGVWFVQRKAKAALQNNCIPLPGWWASLVVQTTRICLQGERPGLYPRVGKIPWRRTWQSTPVFLPGKFHGQRSVAGYSPWSHKEPDTTQQLTRIHTRVVAKMMAFELFENHTNEPNKFISCDFQKNRGGSGLGGGSLGEDSSRRKLVTKVFFF